MSCFAGILWAAKRCQKAQLLWCNLEDFALSSMQQLRPLLTACRSPGMRNLRELHLLYLSTDRPWRDAVDCAQLFRPNAAAAAPCNIANSAAAFEYILQCCAGHARSSLRVLCGEVPALVPGLRFPVMPNLRHLMLAVESGKGLPELVASLPLMLQLETIHLCHKPGSYAKTPALDLTACRKLQSIWLGGIAPAGLALARSCQLHLDLYDLDLAFEPVWSTVSFVQTLYICGVQVSSDPLCHTPLPLLYGSVQLDTVFLENCIFANMPEMTAPLGGARHLSITGREVHLRIPAANRWEILEVWAWGFLALDFEDRNAFLSSPPAFTFEFTGTIGLGIWDLVKGLGDAAQLQVKHHEKFHEGTLMHLCNRCLSGSASEDWCCRLQEEHKQGACARFDDKPQNCRCSACAHCLISAGKISG